VTGLEESGHPAQWAAGLTLGDPFGFTVKRYLGGADAIDFNIALAYGPGFRVGVDWLWGLGRLERHPKFNLDLYFGVGPFVGTMQGPCGPSAFPDRCNGDVYFGGRVPVGVELLLKEVPLTFGLELAPGLGIAPGRAGLILDFLLALRLLL
jgi:hypothetical protein